MCTQVNLIVCKLHLNKEFFKKSGRWEYKHHLKKKWAQRWYCVSKKQKSPERRSGSAWSLEIGPPPFISRQSTAPQNGSKCAYLCHLCVSLTGYKVPILNIILAVTQRVFLDEISMWISGLGAESSRWPSSLNKRWRKEAFTTPSPSPFSCLTAWAGTAHLWSSGRNLQRHPPALSPWTWTVLHHPPSWASSLQMADHSGDSTAAEVMQGNAL